MCRNARELWVPRLCLSSGIREAAELGVHPDMQPKRWPHPKNRTGVGSLSHISVTGIPRAAGWLVLLTGKGKPNEQIAAFGNSLGSWLAKAAKFQTAASEDKPWPWSPLD